MASYLFQILFSIPGEEDLERGLIHEGSAGVVGGQERLDLPFIDILGIPGLVFVVRRHFWIVLVEPMSPFMREISRLRILSRENRPSSMAASRTHQQKKTCPSPAKTGASHVLVYLMHGSCHWLGSFLRIDATLNRRAQSCLYSFLPLSLSLYLFFSLYLVLNKVGRVIKVP